MVGGEGGGRREKSKEADPPHTWPTRYITVRGPTKISEDGTTCWRQYDRKTNEDLLARSPAASTYRPGWHARTDTDKSALKRMPTLVMKPHERHGVGGGSPRAPNLKQAVFFLLFEPQVALLFHLDPELPVGTPASFSLQHTLGLRNNASLASSLGSKLCSTPWRFVGMIPHLIFQACLRLR